MEFTPELMFENPLMFTPTLMGASLLCDLCVLMFC